MKQYIAPKSRYVVLCTESLVAALSFKEEISSQEELARKKEYGWSSADWEPAEGEE